MHKITVNMQKMVFLQLVSHIRYRSLVTEPKTIALQMKILIFYIYSMAY